MANVGSQDRTLRFIGGSSLFGVKWGMSGVCPVGPFQRAASRPDRPQCS